jgi:hypothetical protein
MHLELSVPGLLAPPAVPRLPALELLAARGRETQAEPLALERWLARACEVEDDPPAAGALTALAAGREPGEAWWLRADPLHIAVGAEGISLAPDAARALGQAEADELIAALNRHFGEEFAFVAESPRRWCLRSTADMPVVAATAAESAPAPVSPLPQGAGARRALAFMTEVQMVLHDHPANRAREQRGEPAINSIWLWGAGRLPREARVPWQSLRSDDPVAVGIARLAGIRHAPVPTGAAAWLEHAPRDGRHLCVLAPARSAQERESLEQRWFEPLVHALREERIGMVTVRVPDAGESWETTRADLRRFWRRPRLLAPRP